MIKRTFYFLVITCLLLVTSASAKTPEKIYAGDLKDIQTSDEQKVEIQASTDYTSLYKTIIDKYVQALDENWDHLKLVQNNLSPIVNYNSSTYITKDHLGYCFYDVNKDKTPELLIGYLDSNNSSRSYLIDSYTVYNNQLRQLYALSNINEVYNLTTNDYFSYASADFEYYMSIEQGNLVFVEGVLIDYNANPETFWHTNDSDNYRQEKISKSKYDEIRNRYSKKDIDFTLISKFSDQKEFEFRVYTGYEMNPLSNPQAKVGDWTFTGDNSGYLTATLSETAPYNQITFSAGSDYLTVTKTIDELYSDRINMIVLARKLNYEFTFGRDNWKFLNYSEDKPTLTNSDLSTLYLGSDSEDREIIDSDLREKCDGHCYGFAVSSALQKLGRLNIAGAFGKSNLYDVEKTNNTKSLLEYYQIGQDLKKHIKDTNDFIVKYYRNSTSSFDTVSILNDLRASADKVKSGGCPVVILYRGDSSGHVVLGYAAESGSFPSNRVDNKVYDTRILIYDSNATVNGKDNDYNENYNLLFDSRTGEWEVPGYIGGKLNDLSNSYDGGQLFFYDKADMLDPKLNNYASYDFNQNLKVKGKDLVKISKSATGESWEVNPATGEVKGSSSLITIPKADAGSGESEISIILPDNSSTYEVSCVNNNLDFDLIHPTYSVHVEANQNNGIVLKPNCNVDLKNNTGDMKLTVVNTKITDAKLDDFVFTKNNPGNVSIKSTTSGFNVSADRMQGMQIQGKDSSGVKDSTTVTSSKGSLEVDSQNQKILIDNEDPNVPDEPDQPSTPDKPDNPSQPTQPSKPETTTKVPIYRLYNSISYEHLFTSDRNEYDTLPSRGWTQEGVGWNAPSTGNAVYRLYSPITHNHLFTTDMNEKNVLSSSGWQVDNGDRPLFYSGGNVPIYRLYNEGLRQHLLTRDDNEYSTLGRGGWNMEGVKLYALSDSSTTTPTTTSTPSTPSQPTEPDTPNASSGDVMISYRAHVQESGWLSYVNSGETIGDINSSNGIQAFEVDVKDSPNISTSSTVYVEDLGWLNPAGDGEVAGMTGVDLNIQAIKLNLTGPDASQYSIAYRIHTVNGGWSNWGYDGQTIGNTEKLEKINGMQIKVEHK